MEEIRTEWVNRWEVRKNAYTNKTKERLLKPFDCALQTFEKDIQRCQDTSHMLVGKLFKNCVPTKWLQHLNVEPYFTNGQLGLNKGGQYTPYMYIDSIKYAATSPYSRRTEQRDGTHFKPVFVVSGMYYKARTNLS